MYPASSKAYFLSFIDSLLDVKTFLEEIEAAVFYSALGGIDFSFTTATY